MALHFISCHIPSKYSFVFSQIRWSRTHRAAAEALIGQLLWVGGNLVSELITVIKYTCAFPAVTQHVKMSGKTTLLWHLKLSAFNSLVKNKWTTHISVFLQKNIHICFIRRYLKRICLLTGELLMKLVGIIWQ